MLLDQNYKPGKSLKEEMVKLAPFVILRVKLLLLAMEIMNKDQRLITSLL